MDTFWEILKWVGIAILVGGTAFMLWIFYSILHAFSSFMDEIFPSQKQREKRRIAYEKWKTEADAINLKLWTEGKAIREAEYTSVYGYVQALDRLCKLQGKVQGESRYPLPRSSYTSRFIDARQNIEYRRNRDFKAGMPFAPAADLAAARKLLQLSESFTCQDITEGLEKALAPYDDKVLKAQRAPKGVYATAELKRQECRDAATMMRAMLNTQHYKL